MTCKGANRDGASPNQADSESQVAARDAGWPTNQLIDWSVFFVLAALGVKHRLSANKVNKKASAISWFPVGWSRAMV